MLQNRTSKVILLRVVAQNRLVKSSELPQSKMNLKYWDRLQQ